MGRLHIHKSLRCLQKRAIAQQWYIMLEQHGSSVMREPTCNFRDEAEVQRRTWADVLLVSAATLTLVSRASTAQPAEAAVII